MNRAGLPKSDDSRLGHSRTSMWLTRAYVPRSFGPTPSALFKTALAVLSRHKAFLAKKPLLPFQLRVIVNQEFSVRSLTKIPVVPVNLHGHDASGRQVVRQAR